MSEHGEQSSEDAGGIKICVRECLFVFVFVLHVTCLTGFIISPITYVHHLLQFEPTNAQKFI